jgi:RHS repeat-associated protein
MTDDFLYDPSVPPAVQAPSTTLPEVLLEAQPGVPSTDTSRTFSVKSTSGMAQTRARAVVDFFGNATDDITDGCIAGCPDADEIITRHSTPDRRSDDPSGWMWRTVESHTVGSFHPTILRDQTFTRYDLAGNPVRNSMALSGTLPLDRKMTAVQPVAASVDNPDLFAAGHEYDEFGNPIHQTGPDSRCRTLAYDDDFANLATSETSFVGDIDPVSGCGEVELTASADYDRGLGLVTRHTDLHGEVTDVLYDGFGRLSALFPPDPGVIGTTSSLPSLKLEYITPSTNNPVPYTVIRSQTLDGATPETDSYREAWQFVDGFGRDIALLEQADTSAGDQGPFIVHGLVDWDARAAARRAYMSWFYDGDPLNLLSSAVPANVFYSRQRYDAFGRQIETFGLDGQIVLRTVYHALSKDVWDAADILPGPHQGTYLTERTDGHGRKIERVERIHAGKQIDLRRTTTQYLPTGQPEVVKRLHDGSPEIVRWIRYDTLGRMVLNADPHTTKNFNSNPATDPGSMKAWRYAYDDAGDLVGTSDARGCGINYVYDAGGRIQLEDYVPCDDSQQGYSGPDLATGNGTEVRYQYDTPSAEETSIPGFPINPLLYKGRLVSIADRGSYSVDRYDGRGRVTGVAKRIAKPGEPSDTLSTRYAPRWYTQEISFDGADRTVAHSTGADSGVGGAAPTELLGTGDPNVLGGNRSVVTIAYTKRGIVKSVDGSYGNLVSGLLKDADDLTLEITHGDLAKTKQAFSYDNRRRLRSVQTYRGPPNDWSQPTYAPAPLFGGPPSTLQLLLQDEDITYDDVDNPIEVRDWRLPNEWPDGSKPVTRQIQYDDFYRVTNVDYKYPGGSDLWKSPFDAEDAGKLDSRRAKPSPHVKFDSRVLRQSFQYDWTGSTLRTDDDQHGFYDRSLGTITNGTGSGKPYQMVGAAQTGGGTRNGQLQTTYDDSGNLVELTVARAGPCLPTLAKCNQRFRYEWDEAGRLSHAKRWDVGSIDDQIDPAKPDVDLRYGYDGSDSRVIKTATDSALNQAHTIYIFGSLELRRAAFVPSESGTPDYERTRITEVPYLSANGTRIARLAFEPPGDVPGFGNNSLHVLLELDDFLGSTDIVLEKATGELVERATYEAYGNTESDYRPDRWKNFRSDYRFTGKEEDVEVGLHYFGKRYYGANLGRWISPDPLSVHTLEGDLNLYAYVQGETFRSTDPTGLDQTRANPPAPTTTTSVQRGYTFGHVNKAGKLTHRGSAKFAIVPKAGPRAAPVPPKPPKPARESGVAAGSRGKGTAGGHHHGGANGAPRAGTSPGTPGSAIQSGSGNTPPTPGAHPGAENGGVPGGTSSEPGGQAGGAADGQGGGNRGSGTGGAGTATDFTQLVNALGAIFGMVHAPKGGDPAGASDGIIGGTEKDGLHGGFWQVVYGVVRIAEAFGAVEKGVDLGMKGVGKAAAGAATLIGKARNARNATTPIRNLSLAGKVHPKTGVPFDSEGFPDFRAAGVVKEEVKITYTGTPKGDFAAANAEAGLASTPKGMTWHHHQDGTTMQLVPTKIHGQTGHTGGFALHPVKR